MDTRLGTSFSRMSGAAIAFVCALIAISLSYLPGLNGPFVFDDLTNILLAPAVRLSDLTATALYEAAFWEDTTPGRPLAMLSFALNYYLSGFSPLGFKVTNLVIHLFNTAAIFWIAVKLLDALDAQNLPKSHRNRRIWLALAIAVAWGAHPLNLTSVLYVVQRMTSLSTLFILLGLIGYVHGRQVLASNNARGFTIIITTLACFTTAAILTKENGVLLPAYAFLIEGIFFRFRIARVDGFQVKWLWLVLALVALMAFVVLAINGTLSAIFSYEHRNFTLTDRIFTEGRALWFYIKLIFIPNITEMGVYHDDFAISRGIVDPPSTLLALIGVVTLLVTAAATTRKAPVLSFGIFWFFLGHSIESTALPLELVHEHRNYLPQLGLLFAFIYYANKGMRTFPTFAKPLVFVAYALLLSGVTYARSSDWKDEWTLYNRDVANHPNSVRARTILGILLHDNKQYDLARLQFVAAANLDTKDSHAMVRLAQHLYQATGAIPDEVLSELEYRLKHFAFSSITLWTFEPLLNNTVPDPRLNDRLIAMYEALISRKDPELGSNWKEAAYRTLGFIYRERREYRNARAHFEKAAEINPLPLYRILLAETSLQMGDKAATRAHIGYIADNAELTDEETERVNRIKGRLKQK